MTNNNLSSIITKNFYSEDFKQHSPDEAFLHGYVRSAKAFSKRLHERQKELLDKFNAEHGTKHAYPFEY